MSHRTLVLYFFPNNNCLGDITGCTPDFLLNELISKGNTFHYFNHESRHEFCEWCLTFNTSDSFIDKPDRILGSCICESVVQVARSMCKSYLIHSTKGLKATSQNAEVTLNPLD